MQTNVFEAVRNQTSAGTQHLKKCVRVNYSGEFNVDLPVYFQVGSNGQAYIAVKNGGWVKDDPEKFINWVNTHRKSKEIANDGQMLRVIKYLKRWANLLPFKTPKGVALTVWVASSFVASKDRDDDALAKTLNNIYSNFWWTISCKCPVEPFDDLLGNLDNAQKSKFQEALKIFKEDASKAVATPDITQAAAHLRTHLGDLFRM